MHLAVTRQKKKAFAAYKSHSHPSLTQTARLGNTRYHCPRLKMQA